MEQAKRSRVFIVDDSAEIRGRLGELLEHVARAIVVGEADSEQSAIDGILSARPDVVILDLHLSTGTGVEVLRSVRRQNHSIGFIVLTNHPTPHYRRICLDLGASHFLDKNDDFMKVNEIISGWHRTSSNNKKRTTEE